MELHAIIWVKILNDTKTLERQQTTFVIRLLPSVWKASRSHHQLGHQVVDPIRSPIISCSRRFNFNYIDRAGTKIVNVGGGQHPFRKLIIFAPGFLVLGL